MGKHRNIKRLEARKKKRRREKENRGSLAVSIQQTDSEQIQNYIVSAKIFAGGSNIANAQLTCEKGGSLAVNTQRTDSEWMQNYTLSAKIFAGGSHFANV